VTPAGQGRKEGYPQRFKKSRKEGKTKWGKMIVYKESFCGEN